MTTTKQQVDHDDEDDAKFISMRYQAFTEVKILTMFF
jgi:hypothetical protein